MYYVRILTLAASPSCVCSPESLVLVLFPRCFINRLTMFLEKACRTLPHDLSILFGLVSCIPIECPTALWAGWMFGLWPFSAFVRLHAKKFLPWTPTFSNRPVPFVNIVRVRHCHIPFGKKKKKKAHAFEQCVLALWNSSMKLGQHPMAFSVLSCWLHFQKQQFLAAATSIFPLNQQPNCSFRNRLFPYFSKTSVRNSASREDSRGYFSRVARYFQLSPF